MLRWILMVLLVPVTLFAAQRPAWYPSDEHVAAREAAIQAEREKALAFYTRELPGQYGRVGVTNPRWDVAAREVLKANAQQRVEDNTDNSGARMAAINDAMMAGCTDPLIHYLHARTLASAGVPMPQVRDATVRAARALLNSKYQGIVRLYAMMMLASALCEGPEGGTAAERAEAEQLLADVIKAIPALMRRSDLPDREAYNFLRFAVAPSLGVYKDRLKWVEQVFEAMDKDLTPARRSLLLAAKGDLYVKYAWDARGTGWASTVTDEGWRLMAERLETARALLNEAWELDNNNAIAAAEMITVEMGSRGGGQDMELWFQRAVAADPLHTGAYSAKLLYLEPKWHGTHPQMIAFAREVARTLPKSSLQRDLLRQAHLAVAHIPWRDRKLSREQAEAKYFEDNPGAWAELKAVADSMFAAGADSVASHLEYARLAIAAGDLASARSYLKPVPDRLGMGIYGDEYERMKARLAAAP